MQPTSQSDYPQNSSAVVPESEYSLTSTTFPSRMTNTFAAFWSKTLPLRSPWEWCKATVCVSPPTTSSRVTLNVPPESDIVSTKNAKIASRPSFGPDNGLSPGTCQTAVSSNSSANVAMSPLLNAAYPRRTNS